MPLFKETVSIGRWSGHHIRNARLLLERRQSLLLSINENSSIIHSAFILLIYIKRGFVLLWWLLRVLHWQNNTLCSLCINLWLLPRSSCSASAVSVSGGERQAGPGWCPYSPLSIQPEQRASTLCQFPSSLQGWRTESRHLTCSLL